MSYTKLLWINRHVKKQELVDEEKRTRTQELRNSGQIVEPRKSYDIPFGIRAIQSGIQVDGIWISQSSTPIPSELKLGPLQHGSTETSGNLDTSKNVQASEETHPQTVRPTSGHGKLPFRNSELGSPHLDQAGLAQQFMPPERPKSAGHVSYKPRKSSHLRYGSHGKYDEETLEQLEGKTPPHNRLQTHRPRRSRKLEIEGESSSAADNERSSGASSDSDATLSHRTQTQSHFPLHPSISGAPNRNGSSMKFMSVPSTNLVRSSLPPQSSKAEYFSVPGAPSGCDTLDPYFNRLESPAEAAGSSMSSQFPVVHLPTHADSSWLDLPRDSSQSQSKSDSPFVPGELHVNKTVRKVNSGFEVLPAGTFGIPVEFKEKAADQNHDENSGERRQSTKLQKKPRNSISERTPQNIID